jgi:hypothetical protein
MTDKHLFSITALFDTPDEVIHAAHETSQAGYTRYDVNTPYPVHGMDKAMKLKPTRLGVFSLAFGILGAVHELGLARRLSVDHRRQAVLVMASLRSGRL